MMCHAPKIIMQLTFNQHILQHIKHMKRTPMGLTTIPEYGDALLLQVAVI
jgi:hypothetical protein